MTNLRVYSSHEPEARSQNMRKRLLCCRVANSFEGFRQDGRDAIE